MGRRLRLLPPGGRPCPYSPLWSCSILVSFPLLLVAPMGKKKLQRARFDAAGLTADVVQGIASFLSQRDR